MKLKEFAAAGTLVPLAALAFAVPASAKTKPHCVVPNVKGKTEAQAKKAITRAHCRVGKVHLTGGSVDRVVISQSPKTRRRERNGYKVSITLRGVTPETQTFAGVGMEDIGTINVLTQSTLYWTCDTCNDANFIVDNDFSDKHLIDVNGLDQTSGQTVIDAGTYHDVTIITEGQNWTIQIVP